MAETADDAVKASDVPEQEVSNIDNANGTIAAAEEKQEAVAEKTEAADVKSEAADEKANGASVVKPEDTTDSKQDVKEEANDTKSESGSPDRKRKEAPVSVSAHDRYDRKRGRGGFRGGNHQHSKVKTRFEDQPESNDPEEIRRQVEFYFSDSNLPIDAYLLNETGGHKNRPVPLKVIHNFKRMRHFQPYGIVRDAVKESKFLNLNDDDEITRKQPINAKFTDDPKHNRSLLHTSSMPKSIYAKGFGDETATTHLDIEAFFAPYGPLNSVRLRRKEDGEFKGSVFVEFNDEETQQKFMELDPKPQWNEKDLEIMTKQEYVDVKHQGIIDGDVKPKSPMGRSNSNYHRERRGSKEWVDKDDWRSRRDRDQDFDRRDGGRGRGRGRSGRGRGRGDRGGRGGNRGGRRRSPDDRDRKRRRDDDDGERGDEPLSRAEAEAKKTKTDGGDVAQTNGGAEADASASKQEAPPAGEAKKRAREDDGVDGGEAKKAKGVEV